MSRLTITSYYTRKALKYGAISLILFFILKTSFNIFKNYWLRIHPPPPPPPNTAFGKLPQISFPKEKTIRPKSLSLETVDGQLPEFITVGKVYFVPQIGGKFLSLERAGELAEILGFTNQPQKIDEDTFRFKNNTKKKTMIVDVLTGNFTYSYDYLNDQTLINPNSLPTETNAYKMATTFLARIERLNPDIEEGSYLSSYWKIKGSRLISAISPSEADFIRIDLIRKELEEYAVMPAEPEKGIISFLISGQQAQSDQIVEVKYNYLNIDREKFGTYPIKTAQQAWQELIEGQYYLASVDVRSTQENIKVRKISLAYFDSPNLPKFIQPIYVFQGDKNFTAYVPAIPSEWQE